MVVISRKVDGNSNLTLFITGGEKLNYKNIFISFLLRQVVVPANTGSKKVIVYEMIDLVLVYRWHFPNY